MKTEAFIDRQSIDQLIETANANPAASRPSLTIQRKLVGQCAGAD